MSESQKHEKATTGEKKASDPAPAAVVPSIDKELHTFIRQIESLESSLPYVMAMAFAIHQDLSRKYNKFLAMYGKPIEPGGKKKSYTLPLECTAEADKLKRELEKSRVGLSIIPRQFVVSLVSQYDAFLGRLIRCLFYLQPGLLNASELSLSFAQILELNSLESAREYLVEKEVEKVLRMSHSEQFAWLENKFKLPLRKDLEVWPVFIEITERRNLFVHCDGIVSTQYLSVCRDHGVKFPKGEPKVGALIGSSQDYFDRSYRCIFEIAVKLTQVLWRKLSKEDLEPADGNIIGITYDLILTEQYDLALALLEFSASVMKKHASDANRRVLVINRAQAYKWAGKPEKCAEIVKGEDWSACGLRFQLVVAVLLDDFGSAVHWMRQIGADGEMRESDYKDWPVFKEFRKSGEFLQAFQEVFGKPFSQIQTVSLEEESLKVDTGNGPESSASQ